MRQAANINNVLMVESGGRLLGMHSAPRSCQVHVLFHQSASQVGRESTLTMGNLGNDGDRHNG